jgi:hypothetical protein
VKLFHQRSMFVVRGRKREVIYLVQAVYLFTQDSTSTRRTKVAAPDSGNYLFKPTSRLQRLVSKRWSGVMRGELPSRSDT